MPLAKAIAKTVIEKTVGMGMSGRAIIRRFQALGGKMRREDAINYIRKLESRVKYEPLIQKLNMNQTVPRGWMVETDLGNQGKYRVFGQATFWDEQTQDYFQQRVSFYTDDYSNTGEYSDAFGKHFGSLYQEEDMEFIDFKQGGLEHNVGWEY